MRALITGAAGFIGSHLADELGRQGWDVAGIDTLVTGRKANVADHVDCYEENVADQWAVDRIVSLHEPDVIFHCAASYRDRDDWAGDTATNVQGAVNVGRAAVRHGVGKIVYFQTALCYGTRPASPVKPSAPLNPDSSYAISKTAAEQYLRLCGVPLLTFRLANIYGPRNLSGPIPTFYKRLTERLPCTVVRSRRDMVFVDDLVAAVMVALDRGETGMLHLSSGVDFPIRALYRNVARSLGVAEEPQETDPLPDDAPSILLDPKETYRRIGWRPTTPLDQGIGWAVDWYREHGVTETFTHLAMKG